MRNDSIYRVSRCLRIIVLAVALFTISFASVRAQETSTTTPVPEQSTSTPQHESASTTTRSPEVNSNAPSDTRAVLDERTQDRLTNLARNTRKLMEAATKRFANIIGRMESRMQKQQGTDTTETRYLIDRATETLARTRAPLESMDVLVEKTVTSENPQSGFMHVLQRFSAARSGLKETRDFLRSALATMKSPVTGSSPLPGATTTDTVPQSR